MYPNMMKSAPFKKYKNKYKTGNVEKPINNEKEEKKENENEQKIDENTANSNSIINPKNEEIKNEKEN